MKFLWRIFWPATAFFVVLQIGFCGIVALGSWLPNPLILILPTIAYVAYLLFLCWAERR